VEFSFSSFPLLCANRSPSVLCVASVL
jgi:hypothetical protein